MCTDKCHAASGRRLRVSGQSVVSSVSPHRLPVKEVSFAPPCCFQQVTQGHSHRPPRGWLMSMLVLHVLRKRVIVCSRPGACRTVQLA